jgi:hypothetical protein
MADLMRKLWNDDGGAVITTEWVFVATILILGSITGLVAVRQAILSELTEFTNAVLTVNQSSSFSGQHNGRAHTAGSDAIDSTSLLTLESTRTTPTDTSINPCD